MCINKQAVERNCSVDEETRATGIEVRTSIAVATNLESNAVDFPCFRPIKSTMNRMSSINLFYWITASQSVMKIKTNHLSLLSFAGESLASSNA